MYENDNEFVSDRSTVSANQQNTKYENVFHTNNTDSAPSDCFECVFYAHSHIHLYVIIWQQCYVRRLLRLFSFAEHISIYLQNDRISMPFSCPCWWIRQCLGILLTTANSRARHNNRVYEWTEKKCQTPNYEFGLRHFLLFLCSEGSWHWVWLLYGAMCHALLYVCVSAVRSSCGDVDRTTTVGSACTHFWLLAAGFYYSNIVHLYMFTLVHYCAVRYAIQTYAVAANELNRSQHTMMAFGFFFGGYIYMLYAKMMSSC